jgi:hypothetical protein
MQTKFASCGPENGIKVVVKTNTSLAKEHEHQERETQKPKGCSQIR